MHGAEPTMHHRLARPDGYFPERQIKPFDSECFLDEVIFANRGTARCDQDVALELSRTADGGYGFFETVGRNTKIGRLTAFVPGQGHGRKAIRIDDLAWARIGSGHDELITRGQHA